MSVSVVTVQSNQWSTGICDCCDDLSVCCFAYWCCPCFLCTTTSDFGECFCLPVLDFICPSCAPPVSMSMRVAMRHRYGIQGDMAGDCVYTACCNICSWCQIAREIKRRKNTMNVITAQPAFVTGPQIMVSGHPQAVAYQ